MRTRMTDRVRYMPLDIPRAYRLLGGLVHRLFVRGELERIFSYRRRKLEELLLRKPGRSNQRRRRASRRSPKGRSGGAGARYTGDGDVVKDRPVGVGP